MSIYDNAFCVLFSGRLFTGLFKAKITADSYIQLQIIRLVPTESGCALYCLNNDDCDAFTYDADKTECNLYQVDAIGTSVCSGGVECYHKL